jgi:hypothetical protein
MIIDSETLYFQWRNLTSMCPERFDLRWLDLDVCPTSDEDLIEAVTLKQSEPTHCEYGYAYFLMEMGELIGESKKISIPKLNAGYLALKYQNFATDVLMEYDYVIVPKLSRISPLYMSPDEGFTTINSTGRFKPLPKSKGVSRERMGALQRNSIDSDSDSYFKSIETYNDELVDLIDSPKLTRHGSAEQEWIGLNLVANYRYTKDTVQLLYLPTEGILYSGGLSEDEGIIANARKKAAKPTRVRAKGLTGQDVKGTKDGAQRWYSQLLTLTSNDMLAGTCDAQLASLQAPRNLGLSPEQYTDAVSTRDTSDEDIAELRDEKTQEAQAEEESATATKFIFSNSFSTVVRDAAPSSASRRDDFNTDYLFDCGDDLDPVRPIRITVFDAVEKAFVSKTLEEWELECMLDDVALMPISRIPSLMRKGFSAEDLLHLSTKINADTPESQAKMLEDEFIREEVALTLR